MAGKSKAVAEFGDFQTPDDLAEAAVRLAKAVLPEARSIVEPTCGTGAFLAASAREFPDATLYGLEINPGYLRAARARLQGRSDAALELGSFFHHDWASHLAGLPAPILIVGNPPWVTNAELGLLGSRNLPIKSNFQNLTGFDALTGKSNFDISEWMLIQNIHWLAHKTGAIVVLCKMAVARKVLTYAWKRGLPITSASIYRIDAMHYFDAAVDACLLVVEMIGPEGPKKCNVYADLDSADPETKFGYVSGFLVSDLEAYRALHDCLGHGTSFRWRSGLKHDCSRLMELDRAATGEWLNGKGDTVRLEEDFVFPLMKSSDVAGRKGRCRDKYVIVTQTRVGEETSDLARRAPLTWDYLSRNRDTFRGRASSIYRDKPDFSIFGVGPYTFSSWKIAISGFYKHLDFRLIGPKDGRPVVFDDTVYFLSFDERSLAEQVLSVLNSDPAQSLLRSMIFWDDKRPITAGILNRLDIPRLGHVAGLPIAPAQVAIRPPAGSLLG